jgi:hypothetical protein
VARSGLTLALTMGRGAQTARSVCGRVVKGWLNAGRRRGRGSSKTNENHQYDGRDHETPAQDLEGRQPFHHLRTPENRMSRGNRLEDAAEALSGGHAHQRRLRNGFMVTGRLYVPACRAACSGVMPWTKSVSIPARASLWGLQAQRRLGPSRPYRRDRRRAFARWEPIHGACAAWGYTARPDH